MSEREPGIIPHAYQVFQSGVFESVQGGVIEETTVSLYVNGQELATLMCSPIDQESLALGFLYNEGVIEHINEIGLIQSNILGTSIDVILNHNIFNQPRRLVLTSGCGGGITLHQLTDLYPPLETNFTTTPDVIFARMRDLHSVAHLYNRIRGVHTSILATAEKMLAGAEDVGRHNTIDKLAGKALQTGQTTRDCMILSSGRMSSEMVTKARRMHIPLIASRTAPTSTAVQLAEQWNICVIGYVRSGSLRVYTAPHRLGIQ